MYESFFNSCWLNVNIIISIDSDSVEVFIYFYFTVHLKFAHKGSSLLAVDLKFTLQKITSILQFT